MRQRSPALSHLAQACEVPHDGVSVVPGWIKARQFDFWVQPVIASVGYTAVPYTKQKTNKSQTTNKQRPNKQIHSSTPQMGIS
jgi:hypothetical protein